MSEQHEEQGNEKSGKAHWLVRLLGWLLLIPVAGYAFVYFVMVLPARPGSYLTFCKSNLKNIGTAMEMYSTDFSGKYPSSLDLLTPKYLKTIPECDAAGKVTYRLYTGDGPMNTAGFQDYYYVECGGENHSRASVHANYPAYDGISGLIERQP